MIVVLCSHKLVFTKNLCKFVCVSKLVIVFMISKKKKDVEGILSSRNSHAVVSFVVFLKLALLMFTNITAIQINEHRMNLTFQWLGAYKSIKDPVYNFCSIILRVSIDTNIHTHTKMQHKNAHVFLSILFFSFMLHTTNAGYNLLCAGFLCNGKKDDFLKIIKTSTKPWLCWAINKFNNSINNLKAKIEFVQWP